MIVKVEVPLTLLLFPPPLIRQIAGGMDQTQIKALFPNMATRMVEFGHYAATTWKEKIAKIPGATGRPLKLGPPMTQLNRPAYEASVMVAPTEWEPNALSVSIYSESEQAEVIEKGGVEINLHDVLPYARKARKGRNGLYLRIPFRHATQSAEGGRVLPKQVIQAMRPKAQYLIRDTYLERAPNVKRGKVTRFLYHPNPGRLTMGNIQAINTSARQDVISPAYAKRLEGLMRTGSKGHGGYLTIRTLSQANEKGWRIPPYPAQRIVDAVKRDLEQVYDHWFDEALQADVQNWAVVQAGSA